MEEANWRRPNGEGQPEGVGTTLPTIGEVTLGVRKGMWRPRDDWFGI